MKAQIAEHLRVVEAMLPHVPLLERIADRIGECFAAGRRLYLMGNGGSAADAQHIAAELIGRFKRDRPPLPAIALTTDSSILTAVSNDMEYADVFARQIEALVAPGDIVWALSVSGRSPNVIRGIEAARQRRAITVGFTGLQGGGGKEAGKGATLGQLCDFCFVAEHAASDRVQEAHLLAYHLICDRLEASVAAT